MTSDEQRGRALTGLIAALFATACWLAAYYTAGWPSTHDGMIGCTGLSATVIGCWLYFLWARRSGDT